MCERNGKLVNERENEMERCGRRLNNNQYTHNSGRKMASFLEEALNTDVDQSAVNALVGSLETQLTTQSSQINSTQSINTTITTSLSNHINSFNGSLQTTQFNNNNNNISNLNNSSSSLTTSTATQKLNYGDFFYIKTCKIHKFQEAKKLRRKRKKSSIILKCQC